MLSTIWKNWILNVEPIAVMHEYDSFYIALKIVQTKSF